MLKLRIFINLFLKTTIKNEKFSVTICDKGAELISFKNNLNREYIWDGNPVFWEKHSPVLFPIVGTLKNNSFLFNGKKYQLPRHGFARDLGFKLKSQNENQAIFSLLSNDDTLTVYPFNFELQITYTLIDHILTIAYKIFNHNKTVMPFSIGAHPAFALADEFTNYSLEFECDEDLISFQLDNNLLSNKTKSIKLKDKKLDLNYKLFEDDALIFKKLQSQSITILELQKPILNIIFEDFKNLGIWTKKNAPFICIEPWNGYSDSINANGNILEKEGIQILEPNESFECNFKVEIL